MAGEIGARACSVGDLADVRVEPHAPRPELPPARRDADVRRPRTRPSIGASVRLDRLLPRALGLALPLHRDAHGARRGAAVRGQLRPARRRRWPGCARRATRRRAYALTVRRATPLAGGAARAAAQQPRADVDVRDGAARAAPIQDARRATPSRCAPTTTSRRRRARWRRSAARPLVADGARASRQPPRADGRPAGRRSSGRSRRSLDTARVVSGLRPRVAARRRRSSSTRCRRSPRGGTRARCATCATTSTVAPATPRRHACDAARRRARPAAARRRSTSGFERQRVMTGRAALGARAARLGAAARRRDDDVHDDARPERAVARSRDASPTRADARRHGGARAAAAPHRRDAAALGRRDASTWRARCSARASAADSASRGARAPWLARRAAAAGRRRGRAARSRRASTRRRPTRGSGCSSASAAIGGAAQRSTGGRRRSPASVDRVDVTHTLVLPFGLALTNRAEAGDTRSWWRRAGTGALAEGTATLRTLPDLHAAVELAPGAVAGGVCRAWARRRGMLRAAGRRARAPADSLSPRDARATLVAALAAERAR